MTEASDSPAGATSAKKTLASGASGVFRRRIDTNLDGKTDYEVWLLTESQAARIINKFNGPYPLARAIGYDASQVFRWRYPEAPHPKRGTGGVVPPRALRRVIAVAREMGVMLEPGDLVPAFYMGDKSMPSRNAKVEDLLS